MPKSLARIVVIGGALSVLSPSLPARADLLIARAMAPVPGQVTVCDGPAGPSLTCPVPQGPLVVVSVIAVGTRPDKHPVSAGPGWTLRGRTLHLSIFSAIDPRHEVTFGTDVTVREWRVEFTIVTGAQGGRPFPYSAAPACSQANDPVCQFGPGTPGKLVAPPVLAQTTDLILLACTAHDEGGALVAPEGYSVLSSGKLRTASWVWAATTGPNGQAVACHTENPDFGHGIAARVVVPGA